MEDLIRFQQGQSPFDSIRRIREDGTEFWSAREMMPLLGYFQWHKFLILIERAKATCKNTGHDHSSIFTYGGKSVGFGKGGKSALDVEIARFGCYLVAMNGDPNKPEIAAAQQYFAVMTRVAELQASAPTPPPTPISKPWGDRFKETTQDHFCYMNINHPGYFSVVSAASLQMLMMEDELIRHLLPVSTSDLPDGSIGSHWEKHRKSKGMPPSTLRAPLLIPGRGINANVLIYPIKEIGEFMTWLSSVYIPEHLPNYYQNKKEFHPYGKLPSASAADHTCRGLTGQPASLKAPIRRQLAAAGGFVPASKALPPPLGRQRKLFGEHE